VLLGEISKDLNVLESTADCDTEITDICYDSRKVKKGSLFVAIEGFEDDGHRYIPSAVNNGAAAVICRKRPDIPCPYILTDNTRLALALVSARFFGNPSEKLYMIGVTGTNGKTTTSIIIKNLIEMCSGEKAGLIGTIDNMAGDRVLASELTTSTTPESRDVQELLALMEGEGCRYAVMEASSHALELSRVEGIEYSVGVFTNLTQDHLEFHKTMESYGAAKSKLFKISRCAVINCDDPWAGAMISSAKGRVLTYGIDSEEAALKAENIDLRPDSVSFDALYEGQRERIKLGIPARFSVYNALAAIGTCLALGFDLKSISHAIAKCRGVKGRLEVVPTPGRDFTILIDYAHTPDSLENILKTFRSFAKGRVIVLFGCGGDRDKTKRPIMGKISAQYSDLVIVTSDNPRKEEPRAIIDDILEGMKGTQTPFMVIEDRRGAIRWAIDNAQKDDIIILAGKGHETYQIVGKEKHHMDEREIVAGILAEKPIN